MEKENAKHLLLKYNAGEANALEVKEIERLIESGVIELDDLTILSKFDTYVNTFQTPNPSLQLDDTFYDMLAAQRKAEKRSSWKNIFSLPDLFPRLAFATVTLLVGMVAGYLFNRPSNDPEQMQVLAKEVTDLKEMMMLSLLEKESATERLRAVSLTNEMDEVSNKVTSALLHTLNNDENVNVRLAALEALKPYMKNSGVREAIIESIGIQESPLIQMALAEFMAAINEKSSVKEFEKLLESERTPVEVKNKIRESIKVLS